MKFFKRFKSIKKRKHEGAAKTKRTSGWCVNGTDANSVIKWDLNTLRNRSRDLRRNNPTAKRAIEVTTNNVVGKGIQTRITGNGSENLQKLFKEWAGSTACDYNEKHNLAGLQRLIMDAVQESGEVLVRRRYVNDQKFPIQYQVLESDFLNGSLLDGNSSNGNTVIQGIEFDKDGKIVGYHLYGSHPGSSTATLKMESTFVPKDEILHIYRQERPGQVRGIPWSTVNIIRLKDLDDFQDAQLMRQKIAALFTAFVQDISADVECEDTSDFGENMEPGMIEELPPGKTVTFASPPTVENYKEFTSVELRSIAAGYGLSYAALTGDLSEVNFSAGRMGHLEMKRNVEVWREDIQIQSFLRPVFNDFKRMMSITGVMVAADIAAKHIPPKAEMIDPTKEVPAAIKAVRSGLSSLSDEISASGKDPDEVFEQLEKDQIKSEEKGLKLDSNPKYTSSNGSKQDEEQDDQDS
jgi:lambda family phage portal protein